MELDNKELIGYIDDMTCLLTTIRSEKHAAAVDEAIRQLTQLKEDKYEISREDASAVHEEAAYIKQKEEFQNKLCDQYRKYLLAITISPLIDEITANIDAVFVKQVICNDPVHEPKKKSQSTSSNAANENGNTVKSYKDILFKEAERCENVYILGDAGIGKSALCIKVLNTWVSAVTKQKESRETSTLSIDEDDMCEFDIVLYVSLRHAEDDTDIIAMIHNQLFEEYPYMTDIAKAILQREPQKCLVVIDGLDEYCPPPQAHKSKSSGRDSRLPGRKCLNRCTVVTTTRSWKLDALRLKDHEIDRAVKIMGIQDKPELVSRIIESLTDCGSKNAKQKANEFLNIVKIRDLYSSLDNPLFLAFFLCLWLDDGKLENSLTKNYIGILELLIKMAEKKGLLSTVQDLETCKEIWSKTDSKSPDFIQEKGLCQEYWGLIIKLSELAFNTLFTKSNETSALVFSEESLNKEFSPEELAIAVKVGILCQSKVVGTFSRRKSNFHFYTKPYKNF